jgi:ketosteroid isomerase-like protein
MNDRELRELCNRFLDALDASDIETIADIYHPDMKFWINLTGEEKTREQNLAVLEAGKTVNRRRTYDHRRINTFAGGFICQFSCNIVRLDGSKHSAWACIVVRCKDGKFLRIDEYLDSSKSRPAQKAA